MLFVESVILYFSFIAHYCVTMSKSFDIKRRLPIVYVYTVVPRVCQQGLPLYIKVSLEQAIMSQPDCDVIFARFATYMLQIKLKLMK